MISTTGLDLIGSRGHAIHNSLAVHHEDNSKLAVVLSGYAYSTQAPVFFYTRSLLWEAGFDILSIDFNYFAIPEFLSLPEVDGDAWIHQDCMIIKDAVVALEQYDSITFVGKSLGTTATLEILSSGGLPQVDRVIWLTPGTEAKRIYEFIAATETETLVIAGSIDRWHETAYVNLARKNDRVTMHVINGAAHALEDPTSTLRSIDLLKETATHIADFLSVAQ